MNKDTANTTSPKIIFLSRAEMVKLNTEKGFVFFEKGKAKFHRVLSSIAFRNHLIEVCYKLPDNSGTTTKVWKMDMDPMSDRYGSLRMVYECDKVDAAKDWIKSQEGV